MSDELNGGGRKRSTRTTRGSNNDRENKPQIEKHHGVQGEIDSPKPTGKQTPERPGNSAGNNAAGAKTPEGGDKGAGASGDGINAAAGQAGKLQGQKDAKKGNRGGSGQGKPEGRSTRGGVNTNNNDNDKGSSAKGNRNTDKKQAPGAEGSGQSAKAGSSNGVKGVGDKDSASSKLAGRGGETDDQKGNTSADGVNADPTADPKTGASGSMKGFGADATGVDYGDKGLKDRLEHQAADAAMDATPYLAQANSARKALKNYNKEKNAAGGNDDGVTDKIEDVADKAVDGGIKTAKVGAAGAATGAAGMGAMMMFALMKTLTVLKTAGTAVLGMLASIGNAIAAGFSAVTSVFASVLGVGTAIASSFVSSLVAGAVIVTSVVAYDVVTNRDGGEIGNACVAETTTVSKDVEESQATDGEVAAIQEESAKKLWSVYSALGGNKTRTAAVLGNMHYESAGLDPTGVETVDTEPFMNGPLKQKAESVGFRIADFDPQYAARFPAIEHMGIGLAQWTNGRNLLLQEFAKEHDMPWYEFDTQMMFMLDGDEQFRQDQLNTFIKASGDNIDTATAEFHSGWIGLPPSESSLGQRQELAADYAFMLERATADKSYADGILAGVNVDKSEGNNDAAAYHQDDGCGDAIKTHYGDAAVDGTGMVPTDLTLTPWKRDDLPESLKKYAVNPEDTGIAWGNSQGWAQYILPDQCVALSDSYMVNLYPEWNKGGRSTQKPGGNGHATATNWAAHFGEKPTGVPQKGAVFSSNVFPPYGHTGIVQHVFENGDILAVEQNIRGFSGQFAPGLNYSWSWQVYRKGTYESENWDFFKPSEFEPQWYKDGREVETPDEDDEDAAA